jgi:hypothetical protein
VLDPAEYLVDLLDADIRIEEGERLLLAQGRVGSVDPVGRLSTRANR